MSLGARQARRPGLTVLNLDSTPSDAALAEIKSDKDIFDVKVAKL